MSGPVEESEVSGSAAYVLFYRRRHEAAADPPDQLQQLMEARALQVWVGGRRRFCVTVIMREARLLACLASFA